MIAWLAAAALAAPDADAWETLRTQAVRRAEVDQVQGAPRTALEDALRWTDDPALAPLLERLAPERGPRPILVLRPALSAGEGDLVPTLSSGDTESGWVTARALGDAFAYAGPAEARLRLVAGGDLAPGGASLRAEQWRLGLRTGGFHVALAQEDRWYGPGRRGALLVADDGRPLPALELGGTTRMPGKLDALGRFSVQATAGVVPGARREPTLPGFLVLDLRWLPVPWLELGATRRSLFGGFEDGALRPIDLGQVLLPTRPHVEGDPDRQEADTDEAAAIDVRLALPVGRWLGGPVDRVEIWQQHGGEDVIGRRLGPIPYPSLAGVANLYGAEVAVGPVAVGVEHAVIEDDLFRWYVGHRVYHDGWTREGRPLGHPSGGDSRTWDAWATWAPGPGLLVQAGFTHRQRVLVADRVDDTVFVFPAAEVRDIGHLRVAHLGAGGRTLAVEVAAGPVRARAFVPGADGFEHRVAVTWAPAQWVLDGGRSARRRD